MKNFLLLTIIAIGFISCIKYTDRLSGKIELRQLESSISSTESSGAWFFVVAGGYSQSETTILMIKAFGKIDGTYRLMEFPLKDTRINIDNSIKTPTIQIGYTHHKNISNSELFNFMEYGNFYYIINCPDIYLPEKLIPITIK